MTSRKRAIVNVFFFICIIHSAKSLSSRSVHCEAKDLMARTNAKLILKCYHH